MRLHHAIPLLLALAACDDDKGGQGDTDLVDVDTDHDTEVVDTDTGVLDTEVVDTDTDQGGDTDTDTDQGGDTDTGTDQGGDTDTTPVDSGETGETGGETGGADTDTGGADTGGDTDQGGDTDTDTDTDQGGDTDTDQGVDTDTDTVAVGPFDHALVQLAVAAPGTGFDLDQDGTVDNALAAFAGSIDPMLADGLATSSTVVVVQLSGLGALATATSADLGLFPALDLDGDPSDNGSGSEVLQPDAGTVDASGIALRTKHVALSGGHYTTTWLDHAVLVGDALLPTATPVRIRGTVTASSHDGVIGFGLSLATLDAMLTAAGQGSVVPLVALFADLDTDGDGTEDAISFTLDFHAASCALTP